MQPRHLLLSALVAPAFAGMFVAAGWMPQSTAFASAAVQDQQAADGHAADGHAPHEHAAEGAHGEEAFHEAMEQAGGAWQQLRSTSFDESSRAEDLKSIATLQNALMQAKSGIESLEMAPRAQERFGEDRAAFEKAVRSQIIEAMTASLELEQAVNTGDSAAAKQALTRLTQAQRHGHQMFRPGRDNIGGRDQNQGQGQGRRQGQGRQPGQGQGQGQGQNQGGM